MKKRPILSKFAISIITFIITTALVTGYESYQLNSVDIKSSAESSQLYDAQDLEMNLNYTVASIDIMTKEELEGMNETCSSLLNTDNSYSDYVLGYDGNRTMCNDVVDSYNSFN